MIGRIEACGYCAVNAECSDQEGTAPAHCSLFFQCHLCSYFHYQASVIMGPGNLQEDFGEDNFLALHSCIRLEMVDLEKGSTIVGKCTRAIQLGGSA